MGAAGERCLDLCLSRLGFPGWENVRRTSLRLLVSSAAWWRAHFSWKATPPPAVRLRIQLDFSPPAVGELDEIRNLMGAASRAEAIRQALQWTRWTVLKLRDGDKLFLQRKTGRSEEIIFPFLNQQ